MREDLPPTLPSMWRLCKLGYRHEPGLMLAASSLSLLSALPDALLALWFKLIADGVVNRDPRMVRFAAVALGVSATATWFLRIVTTRVQRRFRDKLMADRRHAWESGFAPIARVRWRSAMWHTLAWAIFGAAYVGAVVFVAVGLKSSAGSVLLVLAAGARLSAYIGATVGELGFLRGFWLEGSRRLAWLEDYAASLVRGADAPVPERLAEGIRFEHVSFAYPGTERLVLDDVSVHLKPGSVVAIVGENGAGKTTLVKLLCRLYQPTIGRILADG